MDPIQPVGPAPPTILEIANECLTIILEGRSMPKLIYMEYYSSIYDHCTSKLRVESGNGRASYFWNYETFGNDVRDLIHSRLLGYLTQVVQELDQHSGESLVQNYTKHWNELNFKCKVVNGLFQYLSRTLNRCKLESLLEDSFKSQHWSEMVINKGKISEEILKLLNHSNRNQKFNETTIKEAVESYLYLDVYEQHIEVPYLAHLTEIYRSKAVEWIAEADESPMSYFTHVSESLVEEKKAIGKFLSPRTWEKASARVILELLKKQWGSVKDLFPLILNNTETTLEQIVSIYQTIRTVPELYESFTSDLGKSIINLGVKKIEMTVGNNLEPKSYIDTVLSFSNIYMDQLIKSSSMIMKDNNLQRVIKQSCKEMVKLSSVIGNESSDSKASLIAATYLDKVLKDSFKCKGETNVEEEIDQTGKILMLLESNDAFREYHRQKLARRLIWQFSDIGSEEHLIHKLQSLWGYEFVLPFKQMLKDISKSKLWIHEFHQENPTNLHFSFKILNSLSWKIKPSEMEFIVPIELAKDLSAIENYYKSKNKTKKLTWVYELSFGEMMWESIRLQVNLYQMGILLMFNMKNSLKFTEIMENTKLTKETIIEICGPMLKSNFLVMSEGSIEADSELSFNLEFETKQRKLNFQQFEKSTEEKSSNKLDPKQEGQLMQEKFFKLKACIVRIMKMRKVLTYAELEKQIRNLVSFPVEQSLIKEAIDKLITGEYIQKIEQGGGDEDGVEYKYIC